MSVTLEQLAAQNLQRAEVYLERFGGCVILEELTGPRVLKANQWSLEVVMGSEDLRRIYQAKRQALRIALALREPSLGETDEARAAQVEIIAGLAFIDQLLLSGVLDLLAEGQLTAEQRDLLQQEKPPGELLEAVIGSRTPESVLEQAPGEELEMLLEVALAGFPQALTGGFSLSTIKLLHGQMQKREQRQVRLTTEAILSTQG